MPSGEQSPLLTATVIICTKDREDDIAECLDSVSEQSRKPTEVLIVDSGSDGTQQVVERFAARLPESQVRYLRSEPGLTRQRNMGIAAAAGDVLHFFDDDIVCEPGYIEEIQRVFDEDVDRQILAAGPRVKLNYTPKRAGRLLRRVFMMPQVDGSGRMLPSGLPSYPWYVSGQELRDVEVLCGCCCAFRRQVFDTMLFDEFFEGYGFGEDTEFSYRVSRAGRMVCNRRTAVLHKESQAARTNLRRVTAMYIVNHHYIFRKHLAHRLLNWPWFWWSEVGETLRRLGVVMKTRNLEVLRGMLDGYLALLRGGKTS